MYHTSHQQHQLPLLPALSEPISFERMVRERFLVPKEQIIDKFFPPDTTFPVYVYIRLDAPQAPDYIFAMEQQHQRRAKQQQQQRNTNNKPNNDVVGVQPQPPPSPLSSLLPDTLPNYQNTRESLGNHCVQTFDPKTKLALNFIASDSYLRAASFFLPPACSSFLRLYCSTVVQFSPDDGALFLFGVSIGSVIQQHNFSKGITTKTIVRRGERKWTAKNPLPAHMRGKRDHPSKKRRIEETNDDENNRNKLLASCSSVGNHNNSNNKYFTGINNRSNIIHLSPRLLLSHLRIKSQLQNLISERGFVFFQRVLQREMSVTSYELNSVIIHHHKSCSFHLEEACSSLFSHIWRRVPEMKRISAEKAITAANNNTNSNSIIISNAKALKDNSQTGILQLIGALSFAAGRLNFRGAAIQTKHLAHHNSSNSNNSHQQTDPSSSTSSTSSATPIPPSLVTRVYLNILLKELSRRVCRVLVEEDHPSVNPTFEPKTIPQTDEAELWLFGGRDNLNALLDNLERWMSCSTRGSGMGTKATVLLDRVKVSLIPWLNAVEHGNNHRSARMQQTFSVFWSWIIVLILPDWIKRSFHVTYSPRQSSLLLFYLLEEWNVWLQQVLEPNPDELSAALRLVGHQNRSAMKSEKPTSSVIVKGFGSEPLLAATKNSTRTRAAKSPLGSNLLFYSSVRWLPAGPRKLRPISLIRCGSAKALGRLACQKPYKNNSTSSSSHQQQQNLLVTSSTLSHNGKTRIYPPEKDNSIQYLDRFPNRTVLRKALSCLYSGLRERRLTVSEPGISRGTPAEDYAELLPFVNRIIDDNFYNNNINNKMKKNRNNNNNLIRHRRIHFVKADASKCFDLLDQTTVHQMITHLVPHDRYQMMEFDAVVRLVARPKSKIQHVAVVTNTHNNSSNSTTTSSLGAILQAKKAAVGGQFLYRSRRWTKTLSLQEYCDGLVPCIPKGWIVEPKQFTHEGIDGEWVRQVLNEHTQNHLRVVEGRLYHQSVGIPQGSTVSSVICDACLSNVDEELSDILEKQQQQQQGDDNNDEQNDDNIAVKEDTAATLSSTSKNNNSSKPKFKLVKDYDYDPVNHVFKQVVKKVPISALLLGGDDDGSLLMNQTHLNNINNTNNHKDETLNLTLRRMDDLMILSTDETTIEKCKERIIRGWPDIGFICNEDKLIFSSNNNNKNSDDDDDQQQQEERQILPWCGLLLHCCALSSSNSQLLRRFPIECSVDWSRVDVSNLARACMLNPQKEGSLMTGFFRAIKSLQMRFSVCCICSTMNSQRRIALNLLEVFSCLASVVCEMLMLTLNATRPHPRIFFRSRVAAEGCLKTHCRSYLQAIAMKNNSSGYNDELVGYLCEITSLIAFYKVIMMYQQVWPRWFKLRNAAYLASAAFKKCAEKKQRDYCWKLKNVILKSKNGEDFESMNYDDMMMLFGESLFSESNNNKSVAAATSSTDSSSSVPFSVYYENNNNNSSNHNQRQFVNQNSRTSNNHPKPSANDGRVTVGTGAGKKTFFMKPK